MTFESDVKNQIIAKYGDFNLVSANAFVEDVQDRMRCCVVGAAGDPPEVEAKKLLATYHVAKKFRHDLLMEAKIIRDGGK